MLERDQVLHAYWPVGGSGAILITSRKYYNFTKDVLRKGATIKPFDLNQSWDVLVQLLGDNWKEMDRQGRIPLDQIAAAKNLLHHLEGLPLAIHEAAHLITNPNIGSSSITKTYSVFEDRLRNLPDRHSSPRTISERSLDTLWDMTFTSLTDNGRALLRVFAWLSPGIGP